MVAAVLRSVVVSGALRQRGALGRTSTVTVRTGERPLSLTARKWNRSPAFPPGVTYPDWGV